MTSDSIKAAYLIAAGVVVVAGVALLAKYGKDAGKVAGKFVADQVGGAVVGIGSSVGIPETNQTECDKALAEGRTWDASFACPAGTFISSFFNSKSAADLGSMSLNGQALRDQYGGGA